MFSAAQYRTKAAEYRALLSNMSRSPSETSEFRILEQTYTTLAENEEWMAINIDKTIQRKKYRDNRIGLDEGEEQILRCVGDGPTTQRNTVATKLQRELTGRANLSMPIPL